MTTLGGYYLNAHRSQFDGSWLAKENCTPTSGANGVDASTGGTVNRTGGQIRALLPKSLETDPISPGWSLPDLDHAMTRLGIPFEDRSLRGWAAVQAALDAGLYTVVQGDSDQFSNSTCSGAFDGNHCIGVHPAKRTYAGQTQCWIDDPICKTGRWEFESEIHDYARKLNPAIRFGVFTVPVPKGTVHYKAVVRKPTPLWNDKTKRWVYNGANNIKPPTRLEVRGKQFQKGGVACYVIVSGSWATRYAGYYVPVSAVAPLGGKL